MSEAAAFAVGVDLGATQVRAALVEAGGTLHRRAAARTDAAGGPRAVLRQIEALVAEVTQGVPRGALAGVGVSAPGPLDGRAGIVVVIPTLPGWNEIPLVAWMTESLGLPVVLDNDAATAAQGEWRFGAGRGLTDFVYVTVSSGIGGGVVADGRLLRGQRGMAAHLGHMVTLPDGAVCACGNPGCWEAQASGTAFGERARRRAAEVPASTLHALRESLGAAEVFDAARAGDALARELVAHEARLLGIGIVSLLHVFSPQAVVIGGGLSAAFDLLHPGIDAYVQAYAMAPFRAAAIVPAQLGPNSGLVGAASLVLPPA